jgi:hypothetical protein
VGEKTCNVENDVYRVAQLDWEGIASLPFSDDSTKITFAISASYGLLGITTAMDHYLSLYLREAFLPGIPRENAHPGFHDWHHLISVGAETSTTMYAFLATIAMHASWMNPKLKLAAMRYYNSTIKGLRKAITEGEVSRCEDWVLHATNFLCLFEVR